MKKDKNYLLIFFSLTFFALIIGGIFLTFFSREEIHMAINSKHSALADGFFRIMTYLGDGLIFLIAIPMAFMKSIKAALQLVFSAIFTGALALLGKHVLFKDSPRPMQYFKEIDQLRLVPGVDVHLWNSFPSGHTMAVFACCFSLVIIFKNNVLSVILFIVAILVGYSRMYLSQHFLIDVEIGAVLGIVAAVLARSATQFVWPEKAHLTVMEAFGKK